MGKFFVMPMSQSIELKPGTTYRGYISVSNPMDSEEDFHYAAVIHPYSVLDAEYTEDLTTKSDISQMVDWMEIENPTGVVEPNEVTKINFTIKVPEDALGGGQYATIGISGDNEMGAGFGTMIQDMVEMSSIIFAEVEGETIIDGEMASAKIEGFVTEPAVKATTEYINRGNTHQMSTTRVTIKNALTGEMVYPLDGMDNSYTEMIMPNTTRTQVRTLGGMSGLGIYNVSEEITYMGNSYTVDQNVIVCPIWFLCLVVATVVVTAWIIVKKILKRRKAKLKYATKIDAE